MTAGRHRRTHRHHGRVQQIDPTTRLDDRVRGLAPLVGAVLLGAIVVLAWAVPSRAQEPAVTNAALVATPHCSAPPVEQLVARAPGVVRKTGWGQ